MSKLTNKVNINCWKVIVKLCVCGMIATHAIDVLASNASDSRDTIRIREIMPIHFGRFTVERGVGSVEVDARSGACQPHNAVMIRALCERGQFEIYGAPGSRVLVQVIAGGNQAGATLDRVTTYPADGILTIGANGLAYVYIGGRMTVAQQKNRNELQVNYQLDVNYLP